MKQGYFILHLKAPLIAFGGETVDNYGIVRDFPSSSMLVGLLANALGLHRSEREHHQSIQRSIIFATAHRKRHIPHHVDFQTVKLNKDDKVWTTSGEPETRDGGNNTYNSPILRYRYYEHDAGHLVSFGLFNNTSAVLDIDNIEKALLYPARPLFIGRKPCLPSVPIYSGEKITANTACAALQQYLKDNKKGKWRLFFANGEETDSIKVYKRYWVCDERNWISGLHGGQRRVCEGSLELSDK